MADLNALLVFAGVAEAGSFSTASRRLGMPVSTVSRQVAALEDQLGLRLIERSTRSLRLTDIGSRILVEAQRVADVSQAVDRMAVDQSSTVSGMLSLSAPSGVAEALLVPIATSYQAAYPRVRLRISVAEDHLAGHPDLMLRFGALRDSAWIALRLLRYRKRLVASPGYLAGRPAPVHPRDLDGHQLLTLPDDTSEQRWSFIPAGGGGQETLRFRPHLAVDSAATLVAAALGDAGICDLPPLVRPDLLRDGKLVEVMPGWRFETLDLNLVHFNKRHVPRPVQLFKDLAVRLGRDLFPDLPT